MTQKSLHDEIFGSGDPLGLDQAFKPVSDLVAPNPKLMSGQLGDEITSDIFGSTVQKRVPAKKPVKIRAKRAKTYKGLQGL